VSKGSEQTGPSGPVGSGERGALTITVLGCDGSYAGPGGACTGYLVRSGSTAVWLDCGPGTLANLQQYVGLGELTAIVTSHAHPDHWVELPVAYNALLHYLGRRDLPVYGTAQTHDRLLAVKGGGGVLEAFAWQTITDGSVFAIDGLRFTCSVTDHPVETLAMRVDDEISGARSFGYSADTGPGWSVAALGEGLSLVLCEATLRAGADRHGAVHLTTAQAGTAARGAAAKRLVITHLPPYSDTEAMRVEAADAFGADVEVATTHARFEL
jgi:ribonuclease BN (tRNA processing enzyme)